MGFDKIPLLRINTSDTISYRSSDLTVGARFVSKSLFSSESPKIVSLVRSRVFLFEQVI